MGRQKNRGLRWGAVAGLLGAIVVVAVAMLEPRSPKHRVEQIKDAITWPASCADVVTSDTTGEGDWPHATERASIRCEHLGPAVLYARFASGADLRNDLLRDPPSAPICIAGREVLVDSLDQGQFRPLCRTLGGDRIDAVSKLPDVPSDGTISGIDRAVDVQMRRDAAAQRRALRRYWGGAKPAST